MPVGLYSSLCLHSAFTCHWRHQLEEQEWAGCEDEGQTFVCVFLLKHLVCVCVIETRESVFVSIIFICLHHGADGHWIIWNRIACKQTCEWEKHSEILIKWPRCLSASMFGAAAIFPSLSIHNLVGSVSCYFLPPPQNSLNTSEAWEDLSHVTAFGEMQWKSSKRRTLNSTEYSWLDRKENKTSWPALRLILL